MDWALLLYGLGMAVIGGTAVWLLRAETVGLLGRQLAQAQAEARAASERLYQAWKDGAHIPPPPSPPPPPLEPLPAALRDELAVWDDPEHRMEMEQLMRHQLAAGKSVAAILMDLDRDHG